MRADLLQRPAANGVVIQMATFRAEASETSLRSPRPSGPALGWRTCLGAWIGLSVASWLIVLAIISRFI